MKSAFIIAEAGVNHNGSIERALELVEVAAKAGADAVKFQSFLAKNVVTKEARTAAYQAERTAEKKQLDMLKSLELSPEMHRQLADRCQALDIEFMSTPFDKESAELLIELGIKRIKISSGEVTNHPWLSYLATKDLPLILSTGMADLAEIKAAVSCIEKVKMKQNPKVSLGQCLMLLHCVSAYPTPLEEANLLAISTLDEAFGLPVGYSDHTSGILLAPVAVALGACVIEKHITLDQTLPGPDHEASIEPNELAELIKNIRFVEASLGSGEKKPTLTELEMRKAARRSLVLARDMLKGTALKADDLAILRPGTGICPTALEKVLGCRLKENLSAGSTLCWSDLEGFEETEAL